jgi:hypothetical protein
VLFVASQIQHESYHLAQRGATAARGRSAADVALRGRHPVAADFVRIPEALGFEWFSRYAAGPPSTVDALGQPPPGRAAAIARDAS